MANELDEKTNGKQITLSQTTHRPHHGHFPPEFWPNLGRFSFDPTGGHWSVTDLPEAKQGNCLFNDALSGKSSVCCGHYFF